MQLKRLLLTTTSLCLLSFMPLPALAQDAALTAAAVKSHGRIARAIEAGDAEEARLAMKAVISEGFARASSRMAEGKPARKGRA